MTGPEWHAVATRLRGAAVAVGAAGSGVRNEAAVALGGDAWLGSAARAAHHARSRSATVTDQVSALLRRAATAMDTLGTAVTAAGRARSQVLADAARFGWRIQGESLVPAEFGSMPLLGGWLPGRLAAVRAQEHAVDAAAAAALRAVTAELIRLRHTTGQPVGSLVDPAQAMLLHRLGVLPTRQETAPAVQQAAAGLRTLLRGGDPVAVRAYVESLPDGIRHGLVDAYAQLIGSGDGIPPAMRYAANRLVIAHAHTNARRRGQTAMAARLALWLRPGRQFLLVDLAGRRVAEVLGNLDTAAHVAVLVPGMLNGLANFDTRLAANTRHLHAQVSRAAPGQVATIAWLGYRTPDVATAPFDNDARAAAGRLRDLVAGLVLRAGVTTTVVAHSYGSLVAGRALREGLRVNAMAALGSPGMGTRTAGELRAPAGTRLFAARAPGDPVAWSENFGRDPADPRFGIPRIATGDPRDGGPTGHTSYLRGDSECLRNLSRIVTGDYDQVTVVAPSRLEQLAAVASSVDEAAGAGQAGLRATQQALASLLPASLERRADDLVEAQERADTLARRLRDPDLYAQVADEARSLKWPERSSPAVYAAPRSAP